MTESSGRAARGQGLRVSMCPPTLDRENRLGGSVREPCFLLLGAGVLELGLREKDGMRGVPSTSHAAGGSCIPHQP